MGYTSLKHQVLSFVRRELGDILGYWKSNGLGGMLVEVTYWAVALTRRSDDKMHPYETTTFKNCRTSGNGREKYRNEC